MAAGVFIAATTSGSVAESYASAAFTPTADSLLVVFVRGQLTRATGTMTSSVSGKTFTQFDFHDYGSTSRIYAFVADQLSSAELQTVTFDCTGDASSGSSILIYEVTGITLTGLSAIVQSETASVADATPPEVVLPGAVDTNNPTLLFYIQNVNAGIVPPTGWTDDYDTGSTGTRMEGAHRDSGFTGTTITWGSASSNGTNAALAVEIDASAGGSTYTLDADAASYTYTATAAGVEYGRLIDAAAASYAYTANDATLTRDIPLSADSAAYAWTAQDAALEYVPIGSTYTLDADSAAYLWSATDADLVYVQLTHYELDADAVAYTYTANDAGLEWSGEQVARPTGGWRSPPGFERHETPEMRRRERERLGILPKQQRAIDRAAAKIVASYPQAGLLAPPQVIAAPQFDRLLSIVQPTEGQVLALAQAIVDRIAWIVAQDAADAEETEQILRLLMEM